MYFEHKTKILKKSNKPNRINSKTAKLSEPTIELTAATIDKKIDPDVIEFIKAANTPLDLPNAGFLTDDISFCFISSAIFSPASKLSSKMSCNTFEVLKSDGKAVISSLIASLFCEKIQLSVPPNSEVIIAETRHIAT